MMNSFNIENCLSRGCNKVIDNVACGAYKDPSMLIWHRNGKNCPVAPWIGKKSDTKVRVGQQKQAKTS